MSALVVCQERVELAYAVKEREDGQEKAKKGRAKRGAETACVCAMFGDRWINADLYSSW